MHDGMPSQVAALNLGLEGTGEPLSRVRLDPLRMRYQGPPANLTLGGANLAHD